MDNDERRKNREGFDWPMMSDDSLTKLHAKRCSAIVTIRVLFCVACLCLSVYLQAFTFRGVILRER